jgi:hypothetical protein
LTANLRKQGFRRAERPATKLLRSKLQSVEMAASSAFYLEGRRLTPTHSCPQTSRLLPSAQEHPPKEQTPLFSTLFAALALENLSASGEKIWKRRY